MGEELGRLVVLGTRLGIGLSSRSTEMEPESDTPSLDFANE